MKTNIYLLLIAFILGGCYEDKGSYNYKDVNSLAFTFTPEFGEDGVYSLRQPLDTLWVTFSSAVTQTEQEDKDNLDYQWVVSRSGNKKDTVRTESITLKFPPKIKTSYSVLFRVRDNNTGVEYYKQLQIRTILPFLRSWFVLHGDMGDRKIGIVEGPDDEAGGTITYDAYQDIWGVRRFKNAINMIYSPMDGNNYGFGSERMMVLEQDSCTSLGPFNMLAYKRTQLMIPVGISTPRFAYGISDETYNKTLIVDKEGKLYHCGGLSYYYSVKTTQETNNYMVDKLFLSPEIACVTVWDKEHKQFLYYDMGHNYYPMYGTSDNVHPKDNFTTVMTSYNPDLFKKDELENRDVLYLGQGNNDLSRYGAIVLSKNKGANSCFIYHINYGDKGDKALKGGGDEGEYIHIAKDTLENLTIDENSQFATTYFFVDQIFYSKGSTVYLYNCVNHEEIELYDAGAPVSKLKFRISRSYDTALGENGMERKLGVVVNNSDGTGELHELFLNEAGDVSKSIIHKGFGTIHDIEYSCVMRIIL